MKVLPCIKSESVDLFLLDLPYANKKFGACTSLGWDTPIDLKVMWEEIKRLLKPDGIVLMFCNVKFGYALIESNPKMFKYELIWKKSKKMMFLSANKMPLRETEYIYVFKNKVGTYNPQKTKGKPYKSPSRFEKDDSVYNYNGRDYFRTANNNDGWRFPTNVLNFANPSKTIHGTQKPVDLLEWLIKTYSNEEDLVIDFTFGSGSCALAAHNTNRKFIGIEKDKEMFNKAKKRIDDSIV